MSAIATATGAWSPPVARMEPATIAPGERGRVVVTLDVPSGCHVQSHSPLQPFLIPTTLFVDDVPTLDGLSLDQPVYPTGESQRVDWSDLVLEIFRGTVEISVPIRAALDASPRVHSIPLRLRYQGCTDHMCLWPTEHTVNVEVEIVGR